MNLLTIEALDKLPTPRLLAYFKRIRSGVFGSAVCDCCGESVSEIYGEDSNENIRHLKLDQHYAAVKKILSGRCHVPKKVHKYGRGRSYRYREFRELRKNVCRELNLTHEHPLVKRELKERIKLGSYHVYSFNSPAINFTKKDNEFLKKYDENKLDTD